MEALALLETLRGTAALIQSGVSLATGAALIGGLVWLLNVAVFEQR